MKKTIILCVLFALLYGLNYAQKKKGTTAEAEALVKKAISFYKEVGKEKAFEAFHNPKGDFIKGDLYIAVHDMTGKCMAQGSDLTAVGKDRMELKDVNGKTFIKERIMIVKQKGKGWQDYKWTNPVTRKVEDKKVYFEKYDDLIFACGAYVKK